MIWIIFNTPDQNENQRWRSGLILGPRQGCDSLAEVHISPQAHQAVNAFPCSRLFWRRQVTHAIGCRLTAALGTVATVAAWMVAVTQQRHLPRFQVTSTGFNYSSYGVFPTMPRFSSSHALIKTFVQGGALLVLAAVQYFAGIHDKRTRLSAGILLAAAFAMRPLIRKWWRFHRRYNFPRSLRITDLSSAEAAVLCPRILLRQQGRVCSCSSSGWMYFLL